MSVEFGILAETAKEMRQSLMDLAGGSVLTVTITSYEKAPRVHLHPGAFDELLDVTPGSLQENYSAQIIKDDETGIRHNHRQLTALGVLWVTCTKVDNA